MPRERRKVAVRWANPSRGGGVRNLCRRPMGTARPASTGEHRHRPRAPATVRSSGRMHTGPGPLGHFTKTAVTALSPRREYAFTTSSSSSKSARRQSSEIVFSGKYQRFFYLYIFFHFFPIVFDFYSFATRESPKSLCMRPVNRPPTPGRRPFAGLVPKFPSGVLTFLLLSRICRQSFCPFILHSRRRRILFLASSCNAFATVIDRVPLGYSSRVGWRDQVLSGFL